MLVFVDTSALVALADRHDENHLPASGYLNQAVTEGARFVIGRPVLVEFLDGVVKRVGKKRAIDHLRRLESSAVMRVEPDKEEDHLRAVVFFLRYDDQTIDMTDSLSFAMMERLGLRDAFTFDHDFEVHGFHCVPSGGR